MKIFCFGDSITWGAWDSQGGWAARLRQKVEIRDRSLNPNPCNMVYNCGVSSDTSERLLARFKTDTDNRLLEGSDGDPIFIFSIGTNDCVRDTRTSEFWVSPEQYRVNIKALIDQAEGYSSKIVFLGNLGVDEAKTHPYAWDSDSESFNSDIEEYEKLTAKTCRELGVGFIDVFSLTKSGDLQKLLSDDGLHENDEGHEYLAGKAWDYIKSKWIV